MKRLVALFLLIVSPVLSAQADPFAIAMHDAVEGRHAAAAAGFHALAQTGDATSAHNLAILFALGQGVPQNQTEAAYWAIMALLNGLEHAAKLSDLLLLEVQQDQRLHVAQRLEQHFTPKAQSGDAQAMLALAVVLAIVNPTPDLLTAYAWQNIAAALDTTGAIRARELTRLLMTDAEKSTAQAQAIETFADWCVLRSDQAPASCAVIMPRNSTDPPTN